MKTTFIFFSLVHCFVSTGQIGGNQLYGNHNGNYNTNQQYNDGRHNKVTVDKTSMSFHVNILNTVKSTSFTITLGLNQEAVSVETCNAEINKRITRFKQELKALNIKEDDIEGTEDITEEAEDSTKEEEEDEMPPKETTKKTPTNKKATPSASKSPVRDAIDDLISGLEGVTVENKRYSFTVLDPHTVHPYIKSEVMLLLERFSAILFRKT